jgi:hypothetical protein
MAGHAAVVKGSVRKTVIEGDPWVATHPDLNSTCDAASVDLPEGRRPGLQDLPIWGT